MVYDNKEKILENLRKIKESKEKSLTKSQRSKNTSKNSHNSGNKKEKRFKVIYERDLCMGAAVCIMASEKYWELDDEGKAILKGGKRISSGVFELEIDEEDFEEMLEAAKGCPVNCIHIIDKKTGKKII